MWQALGGMLPIAVAVAVSSVPITVTILLLLSPNRSKTAIPFLIGWVIGVMAVMGLSAVSAQALPQVPRRAQEKVAGALELLIGSALIVLGLIQIRRRAQASAAGHAALAHCRRLVQWPSFVCGWCCLESPAQRPTPRHRGRSRPSRGLRRQRRSCCPRPHLHLDRDIDRRDTDHRVVPGTEKGAAEARFGARLDQRERAGADIGHDVHDWCGDLRCGPHAPVADGQLLPLRANSSTKPSRIFGTSVTPLARAAAITASASSGSK